MGKLYVPSDRVDEYLDDIADFLKGCEVVLFLAKMTNDEKVEKLETALGNLIDKREPTLEEKDK